MTTTFETIQTIIRTAGAEDRTFDEAVAQVWEALDFDAVSDVFTDRNNRTALEQAHAAEVTLRRALTWAVRYTTAPEAYDGFGTTHLGVVGKDANRGKAYRKVLINPQHLTWQSMRYGSGCCACFDQAEFDKLLAHNLVVPA